ncbi:hypothetical protein [Streptomyces sp. NPDC005322]|uniref:hypothetical protein n=1 Tax=Streptomyces sp. NPDC005322 TaxID=3157032 RepID=UPI0033B89EAB
MAFDKDKAGQEPPVAAVDWVEVREFTVGSVERPITPKRKRAVRRARAVRVPKGGGGSRVYAPCAYCAPASVPVPPGISGPRLYEDENGQRLLCYIDAGGAESVESAEGTGGAEGAEGDRRHHVRDGNGEIIGTIRRIAPSKRMFKHTWRIDQPGHPEIVGRNQWASGDARDIAGRGAGKFISGLMDSLASLDADSGDQAERKARTLEWRADGELVMTSQGKTCTITADWLDRRLAFAFVLLGDR